MLSNFEKINIKKEINEWVFVTPNETIEVIGVNLNATRNKQELNTINWKMFWKRYVDWIKEVSWNLESYGYDHLLKIQMDWMFWEGTVTTDANNEETVHYDAENKDSASYTIEVEKWRYVWRYSWVKLNSLNISVDDNVIKTSSELVWIDSIEVLKIKEVNWNTIKFYGKHKLKTSDLIDIFDKSWNVDMTQVSIISVTDNTIEILNAATITWNYSVSLAKQNSNDLIEKTQDSTYQFCETEIKFHIDGTIVKIWAENFDLNFNNNLNTSKWKITWSCVKKTNLQGLRTAWGSITAMIEEKGMLDLIWRNLTWKKVKMSIKIKDSSTNRFLRIKGDILIKELPVNLENNTDITWNISYEFTSLDFIELKR